MIFTIHFPHNSFFLYSLDTISFNFSFLLVITYPLITILITRLLFKFLPPKIMEVSQRVGIHAITWKQMHTFVRKTKLVQILHGTVVLWSNSSCIRLGGQGFKSDCRRIPPIQFFQCRVPSIFISHDVYVTFSVVNKYNANLLIVNSDTIILTMHTSCFSI